MLAIVPLTSIYRAQNKELQMLQRHKVPGALCNTRAHLAPTQVTAAIVLKNQKQAIVLL